MIKIAFCDDDLAVLNVLTILLDNYRVERNCEIEFSAYHSPLDLMAGIERGLHWDILILDILMPGEDGMELAKEIRTFDQNAKIIFLTSSPEYAVQSYTVGAFYYHLKPIQKENFFKLIDQAIDQCAKEQDDKLILKVKTGIAALSPMQIEYCEVINHTLLLHMINGQILESSGHLNELCEKLDRRQGFLRIHRSFLVNMEHIQHISGKAVTMASGTSLPIPHGKFGEIKEAFLAYAFEKEQVHL